MITNNTPYPYLKTIKKFITMEDKNYTPITESEVLTDATLNEIEAGSSCESCTKSCQPGNQNAGNVNTQSNSRE